MRGVWGFMKGIMGRIMCSVRGVLIILGICVCREVILRGRGGMLRRLMRLSVGIMGKIVDRI